MIVPDVNLLVYAMDSECHQHASAWRWWESVLRGEEHIGLTWPVLIAYVRIATHPRASARVTDVAEAVADVEAWMAHPLAHVLEPRAEHLLMVERMLEAAGRGGNLVPDAHLAALAVQHGGTVYSNDADFGRFPYVRWVNPLA